MAPLGSVDHTEHGDVAFLRSPRERAGSEPSPRR